MPLTSAIQSAMAIRHERERREQRRLSKETHQQSQQSRYNRFIVLALFSLLINFVLTSVQHSSMIMAWLN